MTVQVDKQTSSGISKITLIKHPQWNDVEMEVIDKQHLVSIFYED